MQCFNRRIIQLGRASVSGIFEGLPISAHASGRLFAFDGGINIHLGAPASKVVPYVVAGAGLGHSSYSASVSGYGMDFSASGSDTGGVAGGGIGVRLYVGEHWGFKPEFKVQRIFGEGNGVTLLRFAAGVFYQFGK